MSTATTTLSQKMPRQLHSAITTAPHSGPDHAADLLDRSDHAQRHGAAVLRVEVGHQGERRGHQASGAHALHQPSDDHRGEVVGGGGQQRAEGEHREGADQHRDSAPEVGDPADEREHRDVPEQEARDDRGRPLEGVDRHADPGHHVGQREDDDVGVGGREGDRERGERHQGARAAHGALIDFCTSYSVMSIS